MFDAVVIGDANIDLVVPGCNQVPQPGQEILVDNIAMHVGGELHYSRSLLQN